MVSRHAKSACCRALVRRFGERRRQCKQCGKTWRIRQRQRGRKAKRISRDALSKVFVGRRPVRLLTREQDGRSLARTWHHFRKALRNLVARERVLELPDGPLVLLADGIWFPFSGGFSVLYQLAIKPCASKTAIVLDPVLLPGPETATKWRAVIARIPPAVLQRIVAIVVDDLVGMKKLANERRWVLQLCSVHLIRRLQMHQSAPKRARRVEALRLEAYEVIRRILEQPGGPQLEQDYQWLSMTAARSDLPQRVRELYREFLRSVSYYRSWRTHPLMGIPDTNNAIESRGAMVRDMLRRSRAGSNPRSVQRWATGLARLRPQIACNGKLSTK